MNHDDDRGEERLVAMLVAEATERGPVDLEQRVLRRLEAEVQARRRTPRAWLAAAALLFGGIAVVVAVAVTAQRGGDAPAAGAQGTQDPTAPVPKITNTNLPKLADYTFADRRAIDCIEEVARDAKLPFASAVLAKAVKVKLAGATPRQALGAVAAAAGAHLEQHGAVLAVVPGAVPPEATVTLKCGPTPIHELLERVSQQAHLNLVVAGSVTGQVAVDVTDCPARDLVALLVDAVGAEVAGRGRVLAIVPKSHVPLPRLHFGFDGARARPHSDVKEVLTVLANITRLAVQGDEAMTGPVSVLATGQLLPLDIVQAIAATQGCEIGQPDGKPTWRKADASAMNIGMQRVDKDARGAFELERAFTFFAAPLSFITEHRLEGTVSPFVGLAPRAHVLAAIAAVAGGHVEPRENNVVEFVR